LKRALERKCDLGLDELELRLRIDKAADEPGRADPIHEHAPSRHPSAMLQIATGV
jgi:hypothetical protein